MHIDIRYPERKILKGKKQLTDSFGNDVNLPVFVVTNDLFDAYNEMIKHLPPDGSIIVLSIEFIFHKRQSIFKFTNASRSIIEQIIIQNN